MYWCDTCVTADDVREHAKQVVMKRIKSRTPPPRPKPKIELPPPPPPPRPRGYGLYMMVCAAGSEDADWYTFDREHSPHSIVDVQEAVCRAFNVDLTSLKSLRRDKEIVPPRHVACMLCKLLTGRSMPQIGRAMGGRDHTTVLHSCRKLEALAIRLKSELRPNVSLQTFAVRARELLQP